MKTDLVNFEQRVERGIGILTGSVTWVILTAPVWAALVIPNQWLYCFTAFALYWLYRSVSGALFALVACRRIVAADSADWLGAAKQHEGWSSVRHLIVFPAYNEPLDVLRASLKHVANQDFPCTRVTVLLAFESREPTALEKAQALRAQFAGIFGDILATFHPEHPDEPHGKAGNLAYAVRAAREKLLRAGCPDVDSLLVTICDADSRLHPRYLSALSCSYLADPNSGLDLYQPAILLQANRGRIPFLLHAVDGLHSVVQISRMPSSHKLITQSTYSMSLGACHDIGYWDARVVPEDSHTFFQMFFRWGAKSRVRPIYLPVLCDAAEGATWWRAIVSHYRQARRWAWGVSDVPYVMAQAARSPQARARDRLWRAWYYTKEHILWPSHWFLLMGGLNLVPWLAPDVAAGPMFRELATLSSAAIAVSAASLVVLLWVDQRLSRFQAAEISRLDRLLGMLSWLILPIVGFVVMILPAVDAHTRLLLGRSVRYDVTEKRAPSSGERGQIGRLQKRADHWAA